MITPDVFTYSCPCFWGHPRGSGKLEQLQELSHVSSRLTTRVICIILVGSIISTAAASLMFGRVASVRGLKVRRRICGTFPMYTFRQFLGNISGFYIKAIAVIEELVLLQVGFG